ncbi:hypothetical protein O6H91_09G028100 [Diphasiastrum complanatum]|uniref:Uncharacterized protein n=1 Tax=Diphasiastrum complanatum TaxID=34168 RepID=A0ACC2CMF7_DIPCM|nr:hypothetical protein O6H91_09G028100 [Diphasiastrum complanatum]
MWILQRFLVLRTFMVLIMLLVLVLGYAGAGGVDPRSWGHQHGKFSSIIIPGFASTRLRSWSIMDCPFSPLDFFPLDSVWLDTRKVLSVPTCWLKCMVLDPYNQTDHPECKVRPDSGISAITELDPGYITGPLSSVWKEWIHWCVEFGVDPDAIVAAPYDWRLSGAVLENRDRYFYRLKITFETVLKLRGSPSLVFAHSMGNNVFRYFLEWLKKETSSEVYQRWIDDHIYAYYAVGAPLLGAVETVKSTLSGVTFGLPISEWRILQQGTARIMSNSFSSSLWMLPFSKDCYGTEKYYSTGQESQMTCKENINATIPYDWPVDVVKVEMPLMPGISYPGVSFEAEAIAAVSDCSIPVQRTFPAHRVADGSLFHEIGEFDPDSRRSLHQLKKYYLDDPVLNPLTPWERPPIKNVYCMYGVNLKTEVGYQFAPSGKPYPDNWILTDITYETEGGFLTSRSGATVTGNPGPVSGDTSVPYHSLSWCKTWLGSHVNITRIPQGAHDGDVQEDINFEHESGNDIIPNMSRDSKFKYVTFYEDGISIPGKKTAVWELDKVDHRNLVRSPVLLRELLLETLHSTHPEAKRHFVSKARREPMRDEDCFWDYSKARCGFSEHCEYRYVFGDVHLGQSCRLKTSTDRHILHYL